MSKILDSGCLAARVGENGSRHVGQFLKLVLPSRLGGEFLGSSCLKPEVFQSVGQGGEHLIGEERP